MSYFNNQFLKILNEAPSYEDVANVYKVSEDILKQAKDMGLTFSTPPEDRHYAYAVNQFRDFIAQHLKNNKPINTNLLSPFFKETQAVAKGTIDLTDISDDGIDKLQRARHFLNISRNEIIKARGMFSNHTQHFQPLITRFSGVFNR